MTEPLLARLSRACRIYCQNGLVILLACGVAAGADRVWPGAGWPLLCMLLMGLLAFHVRQLAILSDWAAEAEKPPSLVEDAWQWGEVFAGLNRRARRANEHQQQLSITLERFRAANEALPEGVIYLSGRNTIEWMNTQAEGHFGLDQTRDLGVSLLGLTRSAALNTYLSQPRPSAPVVLQSPRRPQIRLQVLAVPFGDGEKMVISRDITQIERLETIRQDFIANVSHELRTPLTVVAGFLETVMDGLDDLAREDVVRFLGMAHDQASRMQRLIEDLLVLSALETGAPAPFEESVEVGAMIRTIFQEAELLSGGRHSLALEIDDAAEQDVLIGSEKEIHSAFANLVSNAVRYTQEGGTIRLGWQRSERGAVFWVEDDGIGIDPAHIPRLTERFFRADRGRSRETGGTGLGLAIVKHVVSRHQAELRIDSTLGQGSRFSVLWPVKRLRRGGR